jgi:hypothetical protein
VNYEQTAVLFELELFVGIAIAVARVNVKELVRPDHIAGVGLNYSPVRASRPAAPAGDNVMPRKIHTIPHRFAETSAKAARIGVPLEINGFCPGFFNLCRVLVEPGHGPLSLHSHTEKQHDKQTGYMSFHALDFRIFSPK